MITLVVAMAASAAAQSGTFGGRYSNYATEVDSSILGLGSFELDTGRESSLGLLGDSRSGMFVLSWNYDHDFEGGINLVEFIPIEFAEFSRDRGEIGVGLALVPFLDLLIGARLEQITIGGQRFLGEAIFDDLDLNHQAILFGAHAHSQTIRPIGWYVSVRGYIGSADVEVDGFEVSTDTTGLKLEGGIPIPVGLSGWEVTPGVELETIDTDDLGLSFDTNRFFINFVYNFGR